MSNLAQNQNQLVQTALLGQVTFAPSFSTVPAQIDPSSAATVIVAGCAVKFVDKAGPRVVVDVTTSASDGPVFGIIPYNLRKNKYAAGDPIEVIGQGGCLLLKSAGAITRGDNLAVTNPSVATNDPVVDVTTTVGDYIAGVALGQAAGAGELFNVQVSPGKIQSSTADHAGAIPS